eukprot:m.908903 g.908903  ORF g.908903 m.908903 type:complete len:867 (-) comp23717_c0_seq15:195-2795(-)
MMDTQRGVVEKQSTPEVDVNSARKDTILLRDNVKKPNSALQVNADISCAVLLVFFALAIRLYKFTHPRHIVFDEIHFGKFAKLYLQRKYFFDVHPPLGKLLFAVVGHWTGLTGNEDFHFDRIGLEYPDSILLPILCMRLLSIVCGAMHVPLVFAILRTVHCQRHTALLGATLTLLDTALNTTARIITLDAMLILCILAAVWCHLIVTHRFERKSAAMPWQWWGWLTACGTWLGLAVSIKFVGLGAVAVIGVDTAFRLWDLLGDRHVAISAVGMHVLARILCLVVVPACIYVGVFAVHFAVANHSGPGDSFMSREFQSSLIGNGFHSSQGTLNGSKDIADAVPLAFGSVVTIRHMYGTPGWLTVHPHSDPTSPDASPAARWTGRFVPCVAGTRSDVEHTSETALAQSWALLPPDGHIAINASSGSPSELRHGSFVRLQHSASALLLAGPAVSVTRKPPYALRMIAPEPDGKLSVQDTGAAMWKIELLGQAENKIRVRTSLIRLTHVDTGHALQGTDEALVAVSAPVDGLKTPGTAVLEPREGKNYRVVLGANVMDISGGWHFDSLVVSRAGAHGQGAGADTHGAQRGDQAAPDTAGVATSTSQYCMPTLHSAATLLDKIVEVHAQSFARSADLAGSHQYGSRPSEWLFLHDGVSYYHHPCEPAAAGNGNGVSSEQESTPSTGLRCDKGAQIFLIGNIVGWWLASASVGVYFLLDFVYSSRRQRGCYEHAGDTEHVISTQGMDGGQSGCGVVCSVGFQRAGRVLALGWVVHYVPFFAMRRLLFLHHYLPALVFAHLLTALVLDHVLGSVGLSRGAGRAVCVGVAACIATGFVTLAPLSYGHAPLTPNEVDGLLLRSTWTPRREFYGKP